MPGPKLWKVSDYDETLIIENKEQIITSVLCIRALAMLFKKYKEVAAQVAIDETINFAEKLAPFISPVYDVQKEVFCCLGEVLSVDPYNCHIL